jgi:rubrerythrin
MAEYIEREALYKDVSSLEIVTYKGGNEDFDNGVMFVLEKLDSIPTADVVEVRHGEWWMQTDIADYPYGTCSVCGYVEWDAFPRGDTPNYCPNCGARMDGKGDVE